MRIISFARLGFQYRLKPVLLAAAVCLGLAAPAPLTAGTIASPYQVGTWAGFCKGAISFTFDDDDPNQYAIAMPLFHTNNFRMTLYTVITWETNWPKVIEASGYGDEIGSHTMTHPDLSGAPVSEQTNEMGTSQTIIESYVTNQPCVTLAYPYCDEATESITSQYYIAARGCSGTIVPSTPSDFLNISSFVCGNTGTYTTVQSLTNLGNSAANSTGWCVYLIHGIDNDGGYSPLASSVLASTVYFYNTNRSRFWVDAFGNVVRYIRERNAVGVNETSNAPYSYTVHVTNALNNSIYNFPITVRRPLPAGWPNASVTQNGKPLDAQLVTLTSTYVMFDVVPNTGDVSLTETAATPALSSPAMKSPSSFAFTLTGQAGVAYTIYSSPDLVDWTPVFTNLMATASTNLTFTAPDSAQFYRAEWSP